LDERRNFVGGGRSLARIGVRPSEKGAEKPTLGRSGGMAKTTSSSSLAQTSLQRRVELLAQEKAQILAQERELKRQLIARAQQLRALLADTERQLSMMDDDSTSSSLASSSTTTSWTEPAYLLTYKAQQTQAEPKKIEAKLVEAYKAAYTMVLNALNLPRNSSSDDWKRELKIMTTASTHEELTTPYRRFTAGTEPMGEAFSLFEIAVIAVVYFNDPSILSVFPSNMKGVEDRSRLLLLSAFALLPRGFSDEMKTQLTRLGITSPNGKFALSYDSPYIEMDADAYHKDMKKGFDRRLRDVSLGVFERMATKDADTVLSGPNPPGWYGPIGKKHLALSLWESAYPEDYKDEDLYPYLKKEKVDFPYFSKQ